VIFFPDGLLKNSQNFDLPERAFEEDEINDS
jgi:hypothetical protein